MTESTRIVRQNIKRLANRNVPYSDIAQRLGISRRYVGTVMSRRNDDAILRGEIARIRTVKNPEAYMRSKGVWYGDGMSMARSA